MSKIETALAKARGQVVRLGSVERATPGKGMVPMDRSSADREAELVSAAKGLARMEEPWLLDAEALAAKRIINVETAAPDVVMVFRELRTKILQVAQKNCAILVAAISKDGDAGFVAANLAVSFSLDDTKTALLLDCSLGAPLFDYLTSADAYGVTDYLRSDARSVEQIIQAVGIPRLRLIPAGRSHDGLAEYFTLAKMRKLLSELRERYPDRYLVLGAPPLTESADASILLDLADYAVLVVPYGRVTEAEIADAAKTIGERKLLGVVFSGVPALPQGKLGLSGWLRGLLGMGPKGGYRNMIKK